MTLDRLRRLLFTRVRSTLNDIDTPTVFERDMDGWRCKWRRYHSTWIGYTWARKQTRKRAGGVQPQEHMLRETSWIRMEETDRREGNGESE